MNEINSVFEWTIENFSCWNYEVHGNAIPYPKSDAFSRTVETIFLKFFPKGLGGDEKHLVVKIWNPFLSNKCELSFIGPDGSLIHRESRIVSEYNFETFTGPTFEKVINEIRKHEAVHTNSLTLRFRIIMSFHIFQKLHTVIDIFSTSLKINSEFCKDDSVISSLDRVSQIQYPFDEGKIENLDFFIVKESSAQEVIINFELKSHGRNKRKTLARICISYQQSNGAVVKHEESEHILTEKDKWISKKPLPIKTIDITDEEVSYVILDLKIITGNNHKTYSHWSGHPDKTEITMEDAKKIPRRSFSNLVETSVDVLAKEMTSLYQDKDYTDFQLRCGQGSFPVHKGILSARSPVFKILLASDMKEASSGVMDIVDLDVPTLARFLGFLYSGSVGDLEWDIALKLYYAADKYEVSTLKKECVSALSANVSISNVCEILSLADKHQDEQLTSVAQDFILRNYNQVLKSKEWLDFMKVDSDILRKTLDRITQKDHV